MAGFGAARVEVAEIHTLFAPFELISLEDTGLVPVGKAGRATLDGETAIGGRLPVNTSGGLRRAATRSRPPGIVADRGAASGSHRSAADSRQVQARVALAQSIGGLRHQQLGDAPGGDAR